MQISSFAPLAILASLATAAPAPLSSPDNDIVLPPGVIEQAPAGGAAIGSAIVTNNCGFSVLLRSVDDSVGPEVTIAPGGTYSEQFHTSGNGGGISIKVDQNGDPASSGDIAQFEYTLADNLVYYDLSLINGDPFQAERQAVTPADGSCHQVVCDAGENPCGDAFSKSCKIGFPSEFELKIVDPGGSSNPVYACSSAEDLVYSIC